MNVPPKARTAIGAVARRLWRQSGRGRILDVSGQPSFLLDEFEKILGEVDLAQIAIPQPGDGFDLVQRIVRLSPYVVFDGAKEPKLEELPKGTFSFVSSICGAFSPSGTPGKIAADLWRLLRPGGRFLVLTPTGAWRGRDNLSNGNPARYLEFLFRFNGFPTVFVEGFDLTGIPRALPGRLLGGLGYVIERSTLGAIFQNRGRFIMIWGGKAQ